MKMLEATQVKTVNEIINQVQKVTPKADITVNEAVTLKNTIEEKTDTLVNSNPFDDSFETKIEEVNDLDKVLIDSSTVVSLDVVDSIESVSYPNPFDESIPENNLEKEVLTPNENKEEKLSNELLVENEIKEVLVNPNEEVEVVPFEEEVKEENELYIKLTQKVYDRDYALGECFENNFIFKSFEDNKLSIISQAQGDDRKFLYKHFGIIRAFIEDVFGHDIELDFIKEEPRQS